jgi:hypothetical protein
MAEKTPVTVYRLDQQGISESNGVTHSALLRFRGHYYDLIILAEVFV